MIHPNVETVSPDTGANGIAPPTRCVIIVEKELSVGHAANAAAVIALTIGQRHPALVGEPLLDASGSTHPGLTHLGIAVLAASRDDLLEIRRKGLEARCDVIGFPAAGQQTTDYQAFRETVAATEAQDMKYVGVALVGGKKEIGKIVGHLALLK